MNLNLGSGRRQTLRPSGRWVADVVTMSLIAAMVATVATGRLIAAAGLALVPLGTCMALSVASAARRVSSPARTVAAVWALLVFSTFVWRSRTTAQLDSNPLDRAAALRIALVSVAGLIALGSIVGTKARLSSVPTPIRWFVAYVVVAFAAAVTSPLPAQALYRVFEFVVGVFGVVFLSLRIGKADRAQTVMRLVQITLGVLIAVVWAEALVSPSHGWAPTAGLDPYTLHGFVPDIPSDTVGTFGGLLAIAALPYKMAKKSYIWLPRISFAVGVATLLAAQYRTGIIGLVFAAPFALAPRYRLPVLGIVASLAVALLLVSSGGRIFHAAQGAFARGRPELVSTLDSRTIYWHAAAKLIRERPVLGWGLDVGSRRALVSIGNEQASTIHGTWFEALLGTGIVGAVLLALAFLSLIHETWKKRSHPVGAAGLGMTMFLLVRSVTGTSVELFSITWMIFAAIALCLGAITTRAAEARPDQAATPGIRRLSASPQS
jgi:O-antigen ligase